MSGAKEEGKRAEGQREGGDTKYRYWSSLSFLKVVGGFGGGEKRREERPNLKDVLAPLHGRAHAHTHR